MNPVVHPVTLAIVLELWLFVPAWLWKRMVFHMHLLMQLVSFVIPEDFHWRTVVSVSEFKLAQT